MIEDMQADIEEALNRWFQSMRTSCDVITLCDRTAEDAPCTRRSVKGEEQVCKLFAEMLSSSKHFGLVVSKGIAPVEAGRIATFLAFALDIIPEGIDHVACIGADLWTPEDLERLVKAGVTLLLDFDDVTPFETSIPKDAFRSDMKDGSFWRNVPDDVRKYLAFLREYEKDRAVMRVLDGAFGFDVLKSEEEIFAEWEETDLSAIIKALSFGAVEYAQVGKSGEDCLVSWARPLVEERLFCPRETYTTGGFDDRLKTIEDVLSIWRAHMGEGSPELLPRPEMDEFQLHGLVEQGKALGIDRDVEALLSGVPVDDVIAA